MLEWITILFRGIFLSPGIKPASPASPVLLVDSLMLNKEAYILGKLIFCPCLFIYSKLSSVKYALKIKFCLQNQQGEMYDPKDEKRDLWVEEFCGKYFMCPLPTSVQVALMIKYPSANAGDIRYVGSILGSGRSPGGGHGNPLQYCSLENPKDRGGWCATVHGVTKSQTQLKRLSMHTPLFQVFQKIDIYDCLTLPCRTEIKN